MIISRGSCWVFDLDDTLYKECSYQQSGFNSIIYLVKRLYKVDVTDVIKSATQANEDVFEKVCHYLKVPLSIKETLLWQYRLHQPDIYLDPKTKACLSFIKEKSKHTAIITDGRSVSQNLKVEALNLSQILTLVSEDWGEIKPGVKRFEHIMEIMPSDTYVYVGDNLKKDFITPNKLGWTTIGIRDDGSNIHTQEVNLPIEYQPSIWVDHFSEIKNLIC